MMDSKFASSQITIEVPSFSKRRSQEEISCSMRRCLVIEKNTAEDTPSEECDRSDGQQTASNDMQVPARLHSADTGRP